MSVFLQTAQGDLDLSGHGLALLQDESTCIASELTNRFRLFLGEWFLDTRIGIPYFQKVLVKDPDLTSVGQLFRRVIMATPGVKKILDMQLDFISSVRYLTATFKIQTDTGAIIVGGPGSPFIVQDNGT